MNRAVTHASGRPGSGGPIGSCDSTSQSATVPSSLDVASVRPSGEKSTPSTNPAIDGQRPPTCCQPSVAQRTAAAVDLAACQQPAVRGEGDRTDLGVGAQPRDPLAALHVDDLDAVGPRVAVAERDRELRPVGAEREPDHERREVERRADRLPRVEIPDPQLAPDARGGEQVSGTERERPWIVPS